MNFLLFKLIIRKKLSNLKWAGDRGSSPNVSFVFSLFIIFYFEPKFSILIHPQEKKFRFILWNWKKKKSAIIIWRRIFFLILCGQVHTISVVCVLLNWSGKKKSVQRMVLKISDLQNNICGVCCIELIWRKKIGSKNGSEKKKRLCLPHLNQQVFYLISYIIIC